MLCGHPPPFRLTAGGELEPLAPAVFATPLGLHPELHLSTFSVRDDDRLLFFTDGLLEARDRAGRSFSLDEHLQTLRQPGLQSAVDELLDQLRAHTRYRLEDDVAVLLVELTPTSPAGEPGHDRRAVRAGAATHPFARQPSRIASGASSNSATATDHPSQHVTLPPEVPDPRRARPVGKELHSQVEQVSVHRRGHTGRAVGLFAEKDIEQETSPTKRIGRQSGVVEALPSQGSPFSQGGSR